MPDLATAVKAFSPRRLVSRDGRLGTQGTLWLVGYGVALALAHYFVIGPRFAYLGFEDVAPNPLTALLVAIPYVLCVQRLPATWERPSALVYWALFLLVVAPIHVLPIFVARPDSSVWVMLISVAACFWLLGLVYVGEPPEIPEPLQRVRAAISPRVYWIGFCVLWIGMLGVVLAFYGLHFEFTSLESFYDVRADFRDASSDVPQAAKYAIPWVGSVLAPIALAKGVVERRYLWAIAAVLTELLLVSVTGYKTLLFSAVLVPAVVLIVRFTDIRRIGLRIAALATSAVLVMTIIDFVTNGTLLTSLFVRRAILVAALNTRYFFEFFTDFPQLHLGHSVLGFVVDYPYDLLPPNLIGLVYYGNPYTSANANVWADAYANFGVVGMVVFTALLGVALLIVDSCVRAGAPRLVVLAPMTMIAVGLSNSALLTVFMTHGLLLTLVVVYLMPVGSRGVHGP